MSESSERRPTLLIIDDDRAIRRLLARIAERSGFDVDTAKDGLQAVEMMELKAYDVAVVDLMMPRLSGYELLEKIGSLTPRPIVLVATALMNGDLAHIDDSMVRGVIRKPFDINAVADALTGSAREVAARRAAAPTVPIAAEVSPRVQEPAQTIRSEGAPAGAEEQAPADTTPLPPTEKIE